VPGPVTAAADGCSGTGGYGSDRIGTASDFGLGGGDRWTRKQTGSDSSPSTAASPLPCQAAAGSAAAAPPGNRLRPNRVSPCRASEVNSATRHRQRGIHALLFCSSLSPRPTDEEDNLSRVVPNRNGQDAPNTLEAASVFVLTNPRRHGGAGLRRRVFLPAPINSCVPGFAARPDRHAGLATPDACGPAWRLDRFALRSAPRRNERPRQ
jgi:hypothetical protein